MMPIIRSLLLAVGLACIAYSALAQGFFYTTWMLSPLAIVDTWNPNDKLSVLLSNGNLTFSNVGATNQGVRSIVAKSSGLLYYEYTIGNFGGGRNDCANGIAASSFAFTDANANNAFEMFNGSGSIWFNGSATGKTLGVRANNDIIDVAVDFTHLTGWIRANAGNWNGDIAANPATNTNGVSLAAVFASQSAFVLGTSNNNINGIAGTLNVGATAFVHVVPAGFSAWNFLLKRDVAPAANDNGPMFLDVAA